MTKGLIKLLSSRVIQELGLWFYLKEDLSNLKNIVSVIHAVLLDAEEQHAHNNQVREWLGKLKEVVYDADDVLDDFSTESLNREVLSRKKITKEVRIFFSSSNRVVYGIKMGHKVKGIQERLDAIANERKFHLETRLVEKPFVSIGRDQTHSFVRDEDVIGRDEDKKNVRDLLLNTDVKANVFIIPIVGIGGLGKTTLAQNVYNDASVKSCFEVIMWVCVSEPFDVKDIIEKMIRSTSGSEVGNLDMDQLQRHLREVIDGKKYLLVLDDVWNESRSIWLDLEILLSGGAKGSRIIVTTRSKRVAKVISGLEPYFLSGLSEEGAWVLFTRLAFKKKEDSYNQVVVDIGKRIVRKCCGVPLAIKTMGSLLYSKDPKTEWLSFEREEFSKIIQNKNDILPTLRLSYDHLPSHLKNCFAYCKLFPKDCEIGVQELICLWMAQSFIVPSDDVESSLKDVGLQYFMDLEWRSFFQEIKVDKLGNIKSCKMHDLMHDLATLVGGRESVLSTHSQISCKEKTRHMSVQSSSEISSLLVCKGEKIRTLLTFRCSGVSNSVFSSLTSLRALGLSGVSLQIIPESIGNLRLMRYLDLSWNKFKTLPNSISKLQNLETLNLKYCRYLEALPVKFNKLKRLVCLNVEYCPKLRELPHGLGDLTSLESLKGFELKEDSSVGLNELYGMNKLRGKLCIRSLENSMKNEGADSLKGKQHLQSLELNWGSGGYEFDRDEITLKCLEPHINLKKLDVTRYGGVMFASWLSKLTNLVELDLRVCSNLKYLPRLDGLTWLRSLSIQDAEELKYVEEDGVTWSNVSGEGEKLSVFPFLESLMLRDCPKLKGWWRRRRASDDDLESHYYFSRLSNLEVVNCPNMMAMPSFPSVKEVVLLKNTSGKPLLQTIKMKMNPSSSSSEITHSHHPLSKLGYLWLENLLLEDVFGDSKRLHGIFQHLNCLSKLDIFNCTHLDFSVDMQWKGLKSLSSLCLSGLPQLISLPDGISTITSLQSLVIHNCSNLISLSNSISTLTSLQNLEILGCYNLVSLPDDISTLTSLQKLKISKCSNLITLPDEISTLTSLQELWIVECPNLWKRCQKETGMEWHKIAHIPLIENQFHDHFIPIEEERRWGLLG